MRDKELKIVTGNASLTLVERQGVCREREMERRGKWRGCRCYLLTHTSSRRITLAGKKAEWRKRGTCVHV
jgi:hypothetical protein